MKIKRLYQDCRFDAHQTLCEQASVRHPRQRRVHWFILTIWYMISYVVRVWSQPLRVKYCSRYGHDWIEEDYFDDDTDPSYMLPQADCARCGLYVDDGNLF